MTPDHWFAVAQTILTLVVGALVYFRNREQKQTADAIEARFQNIEHDFRDAEQALQVRFDRAGHEVSKLSSTVQGLIGRIDRMPEDMRTKFLPLDRAVDVIDESRRDRAELWQAVERMNGGKRRP